MCVGAGSRFEDLCAELVAHEDVAAQVDVHPAAAALAI